MLPYRDSKPVGAADFYFAINATFRFLRRRLGEAKLREYWRQLGQDYYAPVARAWRREGLSAVEDYWREFFEAEPDGEVEIERREGPAPSVTLEVRDCPAIRHLREGNREIDPGFCQHCYHVSAAMAEGAELEVRVQGGNGTCTQTFSPRTVPPAPPQENSAIATCHPLTKDKGPGTKNKGPRTKNLERKP